MLAPVTVDDQLRAMRLGVDYSFVIKIRALSFKVRPLSMAEQVRVTNEVSEYLIAAKPHEKNSLNESAQLAKRMLILAATEAPGSKVVSTISEKLADAMTPDELMYLYEQYREGISIVNPSIEEVSDAKLAEYIDAAKKNVSSLNELSRAALVKVAASLVTRPG